MPKFPAICRIAEQGGALAGRGTIPNLTGDGLGGGEVRDADAAGGCHIKQATGTKFVLLLLVPGEKGGNIVRRHKEGKRDSNGVKVSCACRAGRAF